MVWSVLSNPKFFPTVLIALDVFAAFRWAFEPGEWRRCVYWAAAAILTASVTW